MITREDCVESICFLCKVRIEKKEKCIFLGAGRVAEANPDGELKYSLSFVYWKQKCFDPIILPRVLFHQECFLSLAGDEYFFDDTSDNTLIALSSTFIKN